MGGWGVGAIENNAAAEGGGGGGKVKALRQKEELASENIIYTLASVFVGTTMTVGKGKKNHNIF